MGCYHLAYKSENDYNNENQHTTKNHLSSGSFYQDPIYFKQRNIDIADFELLKLLGKGSFGKVLLVKRNQKLYAMKVMKKSEIFQKGQEINAQSERIILESDCPFVVKLHFAFQNTEKLFMVMDFVQGGELYFHLRRELRFNEQKTQFYAAEILLALEYLHNQQIIYRDLKPENILIGQDGHLKLTDFGLSKIGCKQNDKTYSLVGTPEYLAPEIIVNEGHNFTCDFWSLGALIFEMLHGAPPFYSRNTQKMIKNRLEKPIEIQEQFSDEIKSLLTGLLCNDPLYRLGAKGHQEIKNHSFFNNIDWIKLSLLKVKPPFIPKIVDNEDVRCFDQIFTDEDPLARSLDDNNLHYGMFSNFTYQLSISSDPKFSQVSNKLISNDGEW